MIIQLNITEPGSEQRVVTGSEVEHYTRGGGWYVIALTQDHRTRDHFSSTSRHDASPAEDAPRLETKFLLQRNSDATRQQLIGDKDGAEARYSEILREKRELLDTQKALQTALDKAAGEIAKDRAALKDLEQKRNSACEAQRRYEGDLAILRKEIGEARCREILGK